jgi:cyclase
LLVKDGGLVKTVRFGNPKYVGDPINAVRIFNEKEVDELVVLDIDASARGREPDYVMIRNLAAECRMPLCYGGGVKTLEQVERIVGMGVEKADRVWWSCSMYAATSAAPPRSGRTTARAVRVN